ncbi:ABC transporter ATP-binding protein [Streptomyces oceani]|nr:ABC transporter ATP-binding protein [Streptomyces oceani]
MLRLSGVTVRFGDRTALDAVDLTVEDHETVCLLGPSGSGKSTLLRVVAGLQPADAGRVSLSGRDQADVPTHRRGLGLMFQDHQLFPQQDVAGNIAFGLRTGVRSGGGAGARPGAGRLSKAERAERVSELLELVGLPGAQERAVGSLSGGEQQRVALARALAPTPRLLMLDEPLGQLDRGLRERLTVELRQLFRRLGTTVLAVTHDQGEAFALADRVVVMRAGRVAQTGTPREVWQRPASSFVARFLGFENIVPATVRERGADTPWGRVQVPKGTPSGRCELLVRPAGVRLTPPEEGLKCTVTGITFRGGASAMVSVLLQPVAGPPLTAESPLSRAPDLDETVGVTFTGHEVVVLPNAAEPA